MSSSHRERWVSAAVRSMAEGQVGLLPGWPAASHCQASWLQAVPTPANRKAVCGGGMPNPGEPHGKYLNDRMNPDSR